MSDIHSAMSAIDVLLAGARHTRQRRLLVLSGSHSWSVEVIRQLLLAHKFRDGVWVGESAPVALETIPPTKARTLLGRNLDVLIYDCCAGLHPDALAAAAGAVNGGGLLILRAPPMQSWPAYADPDYQRMLVYPFQLEQISGRFLSRFIDSVGTASDSLLLEEGKPLAAIATAAGDSLNEPLAVSATADQQRTVAAITHVMTGHSRRPLVITSDRGRGKSSALGLASAQLMRSGAVKLVITAPRLSAVAPVFYHAAQQLQLEVPAEGADHLEFGDASLRFIPADELLRHPVALDMLMVDEAAAIAAPLLEDLVRRYNRMVFSTTVHGYEGTGRGFELRFKKHLQQLSNQVKEVHLAQPVRWAENDPVERWLFDALMLNAAPAELADSTELQSRHCVTELVDRDQLAGQPQTLRELFGLLVLAHYQTTPSDLRNLLDGPNVRVWLSRCQGKVVAAALVAEEGGFDEALVTQIWRGERRPRGHLLAQTLSVHGGLKSAPALRYWRVMRVAVHPQLHRNGLGKRLINAIVDCARDRKIDLVGSSFAATADVMAFWHSVQCVPVRLGASRDASSGCHSAVVLSALSSDGNALLRQARERYAEYFPRALESTFAHLEAALVVELLRDIPVFAGYAISEQDWQDAEAFAIGGRQFIDGKLALWKLVLHSIGKSVFQRSLTAAQQGVVLAAILQNRTDANFLKSFGLSGRKALQQLLRDSITQLLRDCLQH